MATQVLSATPTAISGLTADTWYTIQNRGSENFFIQTATSAPSNSDGAFVISPFALMQVKRTGTNQIYVWQYDMRGDRAYGTLIIEPSET